MLSTYYCNVLISTYTGEVHNGLRHGDGTYWCAVTGSTYVGQWVEGRREGRGKLIYKSHDGEESYYDGDWVDNQQEGIGTRRFRYIMVNMPQWSRILIIEDSGVILLQIW